jgi:hypothetical protein
MSKYSRYENTLHIVTPAKSNVNGNFMNCMNTVLHSDITTHIKMNLSFQLFLGKSNIIHARSIVLTNWYDNSKDGDMFLFIDSDHTFSKNDIIKAVNLKDCDLACGIYPNSMGTPTAFAVDLNAFLDNYRDNRILYAGTGFMLIKRPICRKIIDLIDKMDGESRFCIEDKNPNIIPFFKTRFVDPENGLEPVDKKHWLGEDFSFCWMVRQCEGVIRGFISNTLGHEVLNVRGFVPDNFKGEL